MEDNAVRLQKNLQKFIKHVDDLKGEDDPAGNGFHKEYRILREEAQEAKAQNTYPATVGRESYNIRKNRYKDIIAYDDTRVVLDSMDGAEGSDYINANYILNANEVRGYIASQGPLPNTVNDFWRMLLQEKVKCIIMVCKEMEGGKKKCAPYWPESVGGEEEFGGVTVTLENESYLADDCTVRELKADCNSITSKVTQFHYTGWPDHGIPDDIDVILSMMAGMREIREQDKDKAPVVVHCSAGCGRTGTVCAIDYSWDILKNGSLSEDFSLFEVVKHMRTQRQSMIQTPDQYEMAHEAVKQLFNNHLHIMDENIYANFEPDEMESDNKTKTPDVSSVYEFASSADDSTYSMATARKFMEKEALAAVTLYTEPKENYENVLITDRYENVDVRLSPEISRKTPRKSKVDIDSGSPRSSPKISPKQSENSVIKDSGPSFLPLEEGPLFKPMNVSPKMQQKSRGNPNFSQSLNVDQSSAHSDVKSTTKTNFATTVPAKSSQPGKFVSVISVGDSNVKYHDNRPQPPTSARVEAQDNTYSLANSQAVFQEGPVFPNNAVPTTQEGPVFTSSAAPAGAIYAAVNKTKQATKPQNVSNSSRAYAEVEIDNSFQGRQSGAVMISKTPGGGRREYEEVVIGSPTNDNDTYSYAEPMGSLPPRNYRDSAPVQIQQTRESTDDKGGGFLSNTKNKVINTLKKSTGTQEQVDTSSIPGYKQRLEKKVCGPREEPKIWKKFNVFKSK